MKFNSKKYLYILAGIAILSGAGFLLRHGSSFEVNGNPQLANISNAGSKITGIVCPSFDRRPVAVMLESDPVARPLYGISQADIVFEMPVTPGGVTRMMAVFQCGEPEEIGSIRSARQDFIPLAGGLNALYAHWGGERGALDMLNGGILNNLDAMKYEGTTFYRKTGRRQPHNGFTSLEKLLERSQKLGYGLANSFAGYSHSTDESERSIANIATNISINYVAPYDVIWKYASEDKTYERMRDGKPEKDGANGETVKASVVVVMEAKTQEINEFYNRVGVTGEGRATIYQNGVSIGGLWKKGPALSDKLSFFDARGSEIPFVPGKIWIEIVTN